MPRPQRGERHAGSGRKKGSKNKEQGAPWISRRSKRDNQDEHVTNPLLLDILKLREKCLEVISKHPDGISSGDLYKALGVRSSKEPGAWRLKAACYELAREGKIRAQGKGQGAMRYPILDKQEAA
jgi:hypothetical protein